jgi:hypothetical protein
MRQVNALIPCSAAIEEVLGKLSYLLVKGILWLDDLGEHLCEVFVLLVRRQAYLIPLPTWHQLIQSPLRSRVHIYETILDNVVDLLRDFD